MLKDVAITAANCAVGSTAGLVHLTSSAGASKGGISGQRILGPSPTARLNEPQSWFTFSSFYPPLKICSQIMIINHINLLQILEC